VFALVVYIFNIKCVNVAREVSKDRQTDVDEDICTAASNKENSQRWEKDGDYHEKYGGAGAHCRW